MFRTVVIVRKEPGGYDPYGDPIAGDEVRIFVTGCAVAPRRRTQPATSSVGIDDRGREGVIEGLTVYMPYGTDVRHTDLIEIDGELFEVQGEPGRWQSPYTGRQAGVEVAVRRAEG